MLTIIHIHIFFINSVAIATLKNLSNNNSTFTKNHVLIEICKMNYNYKLIALKYCIT